MSAQQSIRQFFTHVKAEPLQVQSKIKFNAMTKEEKQKRELAYEKAKGASAAKAVNCLRLVRSFQLVPVRAMGFFQNTLLSKKKGTVQVQKKGHS